MPDKAFEDMDLKLLDKRFVRIENCQANSIGPVLKNFQQINTEIKKISDSLYGIEKAGQVEGGLVNMMRDMSRDFKVMNCDIKTIKNNPNSETTLKGRDKAMVYVALVSGVFGLLTALCQVFT